MEALSKGIKLSETKRQSIDARMWIKKMKLANPFNSNCEILEEAKNLTLAKSNKITSSQRGKKLSELDLSALQHWSDIDLGGNDPMLKFSIPALIVYASRLIEDCKEYEKDLYEQELKEMGLTATSYQLLETLDL